LLAAPFHSSIIIRDADIIVAIEKALYLDSLRTALIAWVGRILNHIKSIAAYPGIAPIYLTPG